MDKIKVATIAKLVNDAYNEDGVIAFNSNVEWADPENLRGLRPVTEVMMRENDFLNEFPEHDSNSEYRWAYAYNTKFYCLKHTDLEGHENEDF